MNKGKRGKGNAAHEHDLENARVAEYPSEGAAHKELCSVLADCSEFLANIGASTEAKESNALADRCERMLSMVVADYHERKHPQSEVPMEDQRPLDENVQRLIDQHEALGSHRALAQSLSVMGSVMADSGAVGHEVICRRAARFVRVMAMQVTRFLAQPDLRLCHPKSEVDLSVTHCTVGDNGDVQVATIGDETTPAATYPLHELVAAGPISDMSRIMAQVMGRTVVQDAIGQLIERGHMPGLDHLTATHGLDFSELATGGEVKGRPSDEVFSRDCSDPASVPSDSAWQPREQLAVEPQEVSETFKRTVEDMSLKLDANSDPVHVHNLTAHAGYVLGEDGRTKPDDLPLDGQ